MKLFLLLILTFLISYQAQSEDSSTEISFGNQLVDSANNGDLQSVIHLCKNGYHVDSKGLFGATSLMRAAYNGNVRIAKELLLRGADPASVDYGGATPLHLAARMGHKEVVELLFNAAPRYFDQADNDGWTPLMRATIARNNSIVTFLLTKGADPQKQNKWHNDAFTDAVMLLDYNLVKIFVDHGILQKLKPEAKNRLINISKVKKDTNIMALLQEPVNIVKKTNDAAPVAAKNQANIIKHKKLLGNIFANSDLGKNTKITKEDIIELPENEDVVLNQKQPISTIIADAKKEEKIITDLPWLSKINKAKIVELAEVKTQEVKTQTVKLADTNPIITMKKSDQTTTKAPELKLTEAKPTPLEEKIITGLPWLSDNKIVAPTAKITKSKIKSEPVKLASLPQEAKTIEFLNSKAMALAVSEKKSTFIPNHSKKDKINQKSNKKKLTDTNPVVKTQITVAQKSAPKIPRRGKHIIQNAQANRNKTNYQAENRRKSSATSWLEANITAEPTITDRLSKDKDLRGLRVKVTQTYLSKSLGNLKGLYVRIGPLNANDDLAKICAKISSNKSNCSLVKEIAMH